MSADEALSDVGVVNLVKAQEPRLDIRADREFVALMGAANISTRPYTANSSSTGQIIWSQTTPSVRVGVDRNVEISITAVVDFAPIGGPNTPDGTAFRLRQNLNNVNDFGPRQYGLHSICEVVQLRLNDQAFSWEPAELLHPILEYGLTAEDRQYNMGSSAHYPDQQWRYGGVANPQRGVFNSWENSTLEDSRNCGMWIRRISDLQVEVNFIEQIMLSPMAYAENVQCLFGIQNIDLSLTFRQPLTNMFSGDIYTTLFQRNLTPANPATWDELVPGDAGMKVNPRFTFEQNRQLMHITYLQPQIDTRIPWRLNYPYWQIQKFSQNIGSVNTPIAAGAVIEEVVYNNITLHNIPKLLYLFACPILSQTAEQGYRSQVAGAFGAVGANFPVNNAINQANICAAIDSIRINFDTQDGRLSTLTSFDLYKISVKNGYKRSFLAWRNWVGSVLCLHFGTDLNLNPLLCPGVRGNFQLAASVTFRDIRNINAIAGRPLNEDLAGVIPPPPVVGVDDTTGGIGNSMYDQMEPKIYKAYMIIVNTGIVSIQNQLITTSVGSLTEIQVEEANWLAPGFRQSIRSIHGEGNVFHNIYSAVRKYGSKARPYISPVASVVGEIAKLSDDPRAKAVGNIASIVGTATKGRGRVIGGKRATSHSLSRRM